MHFAGRDRQRTGAVERAHWRWQVVMGAQISVKLGAMRLLDDEDTFDASERLCHLLRPRRQQQARRNEARLDAVRRGAFDRLTHSAGN